MTGQVLQECLVLGPVAEHMEVSCKAANISLSILFSERDDHQQIMTVKREVVLCLHIRNSLT